MNSAAVPANLTLVVSGMACGACVQAVERAVRSVPGVSAVEVDLAAGLARVTAATGDVRPLVAAIVAAGFPARPAGEAS